MRTYTHTTFSILITTLLFGIWGKALSIPLYLLSAVGALIPDIDTPNSLIGRVSAPITRLIERHLGGHRTVTHSLIGLAIFGVLISPVAILLEWTYWKILIVAFSSHLLVDTLNKSGIPLFWPHNIQAVMPKSPRWRIQTGSRAEVIFFAITTAVLFGSIQLVRAGGVYAIMHRGFADIQSAITDYRALDGRFRAYAQVEGTFNISQRKISKQLEIIGIINRSTLALFDAKSKEVFSVGTDKDANIYPNSIRCVRGEAIEVTTKKVNLQYKLLNSLLKEIPASGQTFIKGKVKTTDKVILPQNPDTYTTIRLGINEIELDFVLPEDLKHPDVANIFALSASIFLRTTYPKGAALADAEPPEEKSHIHPSSLSYIPQQEAPTEKTVFTSPHTTELYISNVRDTQEILVRQGQVIHKGSLIARRMVSSEEIKLACEAIKQRISILRNKSLDLSSLHIAEEELLQSQSALRLQRELLAVTERLYRKGAVSKAYLRKEEEKYRKAQYDLKKAQSRFNKEKEALDLKQKRINYQIALLNLQLEKLRQRQENYVIKSPVRARVLLVQSHVIHNGLLTVLIRLLVLPAAEEVQKQEEPRQGIPLPTPESQKRIEPKKALLKGINPDFLLSQASSTPDAYKDTAGISISLPDENITYPDSLLLGLEGFDYRVRDGP